MEIRRTLIAATALAAVTPLAAAAADGDGTSPWEIGIAFGYGERSNPLIQSDDIPVLIDIDIAWYGERWFFDNGDVGRTLFDGANVTVNFIGRVNSNRVFFSKTDTDYVSIFSIAGSLPPEAALLVGLCNAVGGGLIRDVLVRDEPVLLKPGQFYAIAAFAGCSCFVVSTYFYGVEVELAAWAAEWRRTHGTSPPVQSFSSSCWSLLVSMDLKNPLWRCT